MKIRFDSTKPVYQQIAEAIEDEILSGKLKEGESCYSQLVIARALSVNPATAAKGISQLVAKGILVKQRGQSMMIATGAQERLIGERRTTALHRLAAELTAEAKKIAMSEEALLALVQENYRNNGKD